ncbi:MAG: hypothetical protein KDD64_08725 [Bdellovibrionales bacterium]|nr:hypothetical protein [Bdellovibrionales bacterium]
MPVQQRKTRLIKDIVELVKHVSTQPVLHKGGRSEAALRGRHRRMQRRRLKTQMLLENIKRGIRGSQQFDMDKFDKCRGLEMRDLDDMSPDEHEEFIKAFLKSYEFQEEAGPSI